MHAVTCNVQRMQRRGLTPSYNVQRMGLTPRTTYGSDPFIPLISRRCYKPPFPHGESMAIMRESRGTMFDPTVFDAFVSIESTIL